MTNEYNLTVEDIRKMAGGQRDTKAARARKSFTKMVATKESISDPEVLRKRVKALIGVAPGKDVIIKLMKELNPAVDEPQDSSLAVELEAVKSELSSLKTQLAQLCTLVEEYVTKPKSNI